MCIYTYLRVWIHLWTHSLVVILLIDLPVCYFCLGILWRDTHHHCMFSVCIMYISLSRNNVMLNAVKKQSRSWQKRHPGGFERNARKLMHWTFLGANSCSNVAKVLHCQSMPSCSVWKRPRMWFVEWLYSKPLRPKQCIYIYPQIYTYIHIYILWYDINLYYMIL